MKIKKALWLLCLLPLWFVNCSSESTCANDQDCMYGQHCKDKICKSECKTDSECKTGQKCVVDKGLCQTQSLSEQPPKEQTSEKTIEKTTENNKSETVTDASIPEEKHTEATPKEIQATCPNNKREEGEECDGTDLGQQTCLSKGFKEGTLTCNSSCQFDTSNCTNPITPKCNDGILSGSEECDGSNLNNQSCATKGFDSGTLSCHPTTCQFDTSQCKKNTNPPCGNGTIDSGEECDGSNLNNQTCLTKGFDSGTLSCHPTTCQFDTSQCKKNNTTSPCGNGTIDSGEECDGSNLNNQTCATKGFKAGSLQCNSSCQFDTGGCNNSDPGKKKFGEVCSGASDCDAGMTCLILKSGDPYGYCTSKCSTILTCPSSPAGSQCLLQSGNSNLCAWKCSPTANNCPSGLNCAALGSSYFCFAVPAAPSAKCGNGKAEIGEDCDGSDLNKQTCTTQGFSSGTLACNSKCQFDDSACKSNTTAVVNANYGQPCSGANSCGSGLVCIQFETNKSYCTQYCDSSTPCPETPPGSSCRFTLQGSNKSICGWGTATGAPPVCGNGVVENGEDCDTKDFNSTCKGLGFSGGTLSCNSSCKVDTSTCTGTSKCTSLPALHCTKNCRTIIRFSPNQGAGYSVNHGDSFSWLRRDAIMSVKYATASVDCMYPKTSPLGLGDMSMSDGSTPAQNGQLRHPSGTHTTGSDIDLAYYQVNQPDNDLRAICVHTTNGQDEYHCVQDPLYLDAEKHAFFLSKILESGIVRVIGIDGKAGTALQKEIDKLYTNGFITKMIKDRFQANVTYETTDTGRGWFRFHHHHSHISYQ